MKTTTIITALLLTAISTTAQVRFGYDSAGNRITREIVLQQKSVPERIDTPMFHEILSEHTVKIYPNPTDGLLTVEISSVQNVDTWDISVYDISGQIVMKTTVASTIANVDLRNNANGIYLMHIVINGENTTWKIIKK